MWKKRGLSGVVTILIIVLLVFVAVFIVWTVVRNVLEQGAEQIELGRFTLDLEIKGVQIEEGNDVTVVVVKRNPGKGNIIGMNFVFSDGKESEIMREDIVFKELDEKSFIFTLTKISTENLETVSVAPIFELSSGKESMGDIADAFDVKKGGSIATGLAVVSNFEKLGFVGQGKSEYSISSQSEDVVKFRKAIVDPLDVLPGDNQTFTVHVYSPHGVVSVTTTTELDNSILNLDLQEIGEENENQIFSATWTVDDVHAITYRTTIVATDAEGNSNSITLTWTDSCQSLISFSDHGIATKTISTDCTTTASSIGGVDGSNIIIGTGVNLVIADGSQFIFNQGKSLTISASGASITVSGSGSFGNGDLYYLDADGDGYTSGETLLIGSGTGRVRASDVSIVGINDCADSSGNQNIHDNTVTTASDNDQDGYTDTSGTGNCVGGSGTVNGRTYYRDTANALTWLTDSQKLGTSDCNDGETPTGTRWRNRYLDSDGDGVGAGSLVCVGSHSGYSDSNTDCNSGNGFVWTTSTTTASDNDNDGWTDTSGANNCRGNSGSISGRTYYVDTSNTLSWLTDSQKLGTSDCNDGNGNVYTTSTTTASDNDQDGWTDTSGANNCRGNSGSVSGRTYYRDTNNALSWLTNSQKLGINDCNDANSGDWRLRNDDTDQDTYCTTITSVCVGDDAGYTDFGSCTAFSDCCDNDNRAHIGQTSYFTTKYTGCVAPNDFDFNCDGSETKQYTATGGVCIECFDAPPCTETTSGGVGYTSSVPACGSSGTYVSYAGAPCAVRDSFECDGTLSCSSGARTQACR